MLFFGVCFFLYFIKLSAGEGFYRLICSWTSLRFVFHASSCNSSYMSKSDQNDVIVYTKATCTCLCMLLILTVFSGNK